MVKQVGTTGKRVDNFIFKDKTTIPMKHAQIIRKNWRKGLRWNLCSPLFTLSKKDIIEIVLSDRKFK